MTNNTTAQLAVDSGPSIVISNVIKGPAGGTAPKAQLLFTSGTFVCNGSSNVTVTEPLVTANSAIIVTLKTVGGTVGATPAVKTITAGTGFAIAGTASDTSTYNYTVVG